MVERFFSSSQLFRPTPKRPPCYVELDLLLLVPFPVSYHPPFPVIPPIILIIVEEVVRVFYLLFLTSPVTPSFYATASLARARLLPFCNYYEVRDSYAR